MEICFKPTLISFSKCLTIGSEPFFLVSNSSFLFEPICSFLLSQFYASLVEPSVRGGGGLRFPLLSFWRTNKHEAAHFSVLPARKERNWQFGDLRLGLKLSFTIYNSGLRFQKAKEYSEFITRLTYNCVHLRLNNKKKNKNKLSQNGREIEPWPWPWPWQKVIWPLFRNFRPFLEENNYWPKSLFNLRGWGSWGGWGSWKDWGDCGGWPGGGFYHHSWNAWVIRIPKI